MTDYANWCVDYSVNTPLPKIMLNTPTKCMLCPSTYRSDSDSALSQVHMCTSSNVPTIPIHHKQFLEQLQHVQISSAKKAHLVRIENTIRSTTAPPNNWIGVQPWSCRLPHSQLATQPLHIDRQHAPQAAFFALLAMEDVFCRDSQYAWTKLTANAASTTVAATKGGFSCLQARHIKNCDRPYTAIAEYIPAMRWLGLRTYTHMKSPMRIVTTTLVESGFSPLTSTRS
mmetsp:Transcript_20214/g.60032  ORF Transcript_20214/g.60032 Transcript_20214/m.60032 type:complete len:228 (+) Transcript_20214:77-760(+)